MTMDADYQKGLMKEHLNLEKGKLEGFKLRLEYSEPFVIGRNPTEIGI